MSKDDFYAGFKQSSIVSKAKPLEIGDRVRGDHPHAGKEGVIEGVYSFRHFPSMSPGVKVVFDDGNGCFVFRPYKLERVEGRESNGN